MKRQQQFSLATLVFCMTAFAVAFAVLPYPFVAYYVLLAFFFCAAVLYRVGPVESRSFCRWFALSGWLYVFLCTGLMDAIEPTPFWNWIRTWLRHIIPSEFGWDGNEYLVSLHSFIALTVALSGGLLIPILDRRARSNASSA